MDPKSDRKLDRKRMSQVQTQDLTESRLNDDFVFWLKSKGHNYLLVVLLIACAVLGYNYWERKNTNKTSAAWGDLAQATLPEAYEQVAKDHADVPQAAMMALMQAADRRLQQVQTGVLVPAAGDTAAIALDEVGRKIALDAADENYAKAAEIATKVTDGDRTRAAVIVVPSLFGRAAVAECRGDFDGATKFLQEAITVASDRWPRFVEVANMRISGMTALATAISMPKQSELLVKPVDAAPAATATDDLFQQLINEQKAQDAAASKTPEAAAPNTPEAPAPVTPEVAPIPTPAPTPAPGAGG